MRRRCGFGSSSVSYIKVSRVDGYLPAAKTTRLARVFCSFSPQLQVSVLLTLVGARRQKFGTQAVSWGGVSITDTFNSWWSMNSIPVLNAPKSMKQPGGIYPWDSLRLSRSRMHTGFASPHQISRHYQHFERPISQNRSHDDKRHFNHVRYR